MKKIKSNSLPELLNKELESNHSLQELILELKKGVFKGDVWNQYNERIIYSTDNSIYQQIPLLILHPKDKEDVIFIVELLNKDEFKHFHLCPRGGGTGTNGQSLTDGIILDFSTYMNSILEINTAKGYVELQPGVILDELNKELTKVGYFFAPNVSTASRATIGGMIANDSSGKGSLIYGKTSDHIIELESVLIDGTVINTSSKTKKQTEEKLHDIYDFVENFAEKNKELIDKTYPNLDRGLTGYNLKKVLLEENGEKKLNLNYLISGAEGSLCINTKAKINIIPIPKYKHLVVVFYEKFLHALDNVDVLLGCNPSAIETIDDKITDLAKQDSSFENVSHIFTEKRCANMKAFNCIEFVGDDKKDIENKVENLIKTLGSIKNTGHYSTNSQQEIKSIWSIRSKGVGLLGNYKDPNPKTNRKPIAFIEDTAVLPTNLPAYISDLCDMLDSYNLDYGLFGHIDAGCLHVRPALDMTIAEDRAKIRIISDKTLELVKKHNGVFWGEHGKGYRAEYSIDFFGKEIYSALEKIKLYFDPRNRLNRSKIIVAPNKKGIEILRLDAIPTRGEKDETIDLSIRKYYPSAMDCNGNALCYNKEVMDPMCPSYKATNNRLYAPKARAGMMREWIKQLVDCGVNPANITKSFFRFFRKPKENDFSAQIYDSMQQCTSCKSCVGQCPVQVDIAELKSKFLHTYHKRYAREIKDYFIANIEYIAGIMAIFPKVSNFLSQNQLAKFLTKKIIGLTDLPYVSKKAFSTLPQGVEWFEYDKIKDLDENSKSVILLQDAFTSFFDSDSVEYTCNLMVSLGYKVYVVKFFKNGKAQHVKGFLDMFEKTVKGNENLFKKLKEVKIPLVAIEPSVTLTYRQEYKEFCNENIDVDTFPEWLHKEIQGNNVEKISLTGHKYSLFLHCTEQTNISNIKKIWMGIFSYFDMDVKIENSGCCGMSGIYGHETINQESSRKLFDGWEPILNENKKDKVVTLATGYSCRAQSKRFASFRPMYPSEAILIAIEEKNKTNKITGK